MKHTLMVCLLVMGLVGCGGLSDHDKNNYERQTSLHKSQVTDINNQIKIVEAAIANQAYASAKADWSSSLDTARTKVGRSEDNMNKAAAIFKENDKAKRVQLSKALTAAREDRIQTKNNLKEIVHIISLAEQIMADEDKIIGHIKKRTEDISKYDLSGVNAKLDGLISDFPNKRKYLSDKKSDIEKSKSKVAALKGEMNSSDILVKARSASNANAMMNNFSALIKSVDSDRDELRTSWTKTLADMDIVDSGSRVAYQHLYKKLIIRPDGSHDTEETWQDVSELVFEANENNLGMAIENKPLGKFNNEVEKVAQHAGYNYMAEPGQSNRYGTWRQDDNGTSFWEFYGQYHFMQSMLWGNSYRPIYVTEYRDYRSSYDNRRPYYGKTSSGTPRYGSKGTQTAKTYSSSKYKNSRTMNTYKTYRKSGGSAKSGSSFSTSRYSNTGRTTAARQAAQSSRSSSSSGSRSGGGK